MAQANQVLMESLSQSERQKFAKRLRKQQLKKYKEWEKSEESERIARRSLSKKKVQFGTDLVIRDAVKRQDKEEVSELLKKGANPDMVSDINGFSLLHQCCIDNAWDIATLLILKGAKVNHVDGQLWSPLHIACAYDSEDMVDLLLENGADVKLLNIDNCFPVDQSSDEKIRSILFEEMEKLGIGLDEMKQIRQQKAQDMLRDLKQLPSNQWHPDSLSNRGVALVHIAAANGYGEVMKYLLKKKADINSQDEDGYTPLHVAALFNQEKMVAYLLKKGADPTVKTFDGETALSLAEDDVIRQILVNSVTAAVKKAEMQKRFETSSKNDEMQTGLEDELSDGNYGDQDDKSTETSKSVKMSTPDEEFVCNIKPRVYSYSFIRAVAMSKVEGMFERETLPDKMDLSDQEMVVVKEKVERSSLKIKGRLKESIKVKKTTII